MTIYSFHFYLFLQRNYPNTSCEVKNIKTFSNQIEEHETKMLYIKMKNLHKSVSFVSQDHPCTNYYLTMGI